MFYCRNCGAGINGEAYYCSKCGQKLETPARYHNITGFKKKRPLKSFFLRGTFLLVVLIVLIVGINSIWSVYKNLGLDINEQETNALVYENKVDLTETHVLSSNETLNTSVTDEQYKEPGGNDHYPLQIDVPADWEKFQDVNYTFYLPAVWEGGSRDELDEVLKSLKSIGPEVEVIIQEIEMYKDFILFWGYDTETTGPGQFFTNVTIASEVAFVSLQDYMKLGYEETKGVYDSHGIKIDIIEQDIVSLGHNQDVGRTVLEQVFFGEHVITVQYIFKYDNTFYILTFTTIPEEYDYYKGNFDLAAGTFSAGH